MGFKLINFIYIAIWFFNITSFIIAKRIDYTLVNSDKNAFKDFLYKNKDLISILLKIKPILLIIISITMSIITIFYDIVTTKLIIEIYFLVTLADLMINALVVSFYEHK